MPPNAGHSQFIVYLEGLKLPPELEASVAREIRAAALRELARADFHVDFGVRVPRKEWLGLWLETVRTGNIGRPPGIGGPAV